MSRRREIMFQTDARHSSIYMYEPPMGIRQIVEPIDEVLDLGIDTINYVVGDCAILLYDTKVGEKWGHNVDLANHEVWHRAGLSLKMMLDQGIDPLEVVVDHAHERGLNLLPHLILNMLHTPPNRETNCRVSDFCTRHPEWQVGDEPDYPEAAHDAPNRLSFAVPEVRENRTAVIRELLFDYESDGIEMNFRESAPFIARREVEEHTDTLTDWLREIKLLCAQAEKAQGRRKRLVARVPATLSGNALMGQDVKSWVEDGIVDTLVAMQAGGDFAGESGRLRELAELTAGTETTLLCGLDSVGGEQTAEVHRGAVVNAYDAGADGILYWRYYPAPHRYPYTPEDYMRLRYLAYPDYLAHVDKVFRVGPSERDRAPAVTFGLEEQLPRELAVGEPVEVAIDVADDIAGKREIGELWGCELRVMLHEFQHHDEARFHWNGTEIPAERIRKVDWIFQMRPSTLLRGYRFHVNLAAEALALPLKGTNSVRVELLKKDAQLVHPVQWIDVDIAVDYLPARNALRLDEAYNGPARPFIP